MNTIDNKNVSLGETENPKLPKVIERLYLSEKGADVHFTFRNQRIPAHKTILAITSSVFNTAFYGLLPEKDEIRIEDACAESFKQFLQFFYLAEVDLSMEYIQNVMYLGHKYQVTECLDICSTFLKDNLTMDEICLGYQLAIHYRQDDLKAFCEREICLSTEEVLKTEGFLSCDWNVLLEIIRNNALGCREAVLLEACINWARQACKRNKLKNDGRNIRRQLKSIIYEIRFVQITFHEFNRLINGPFNPYIDEEIKELKRIMATKNFSATKFNCSARYFYSIAWNDSDVVRCYRIEKRIPKNAIQNYTIKTSFTANKPLIFGEFFINVSSDKPSDHFDILVEIFEYRTSEILVSKFNKEIAIGYLTANMNIVVLPEPIFIRPNIRYIIQLKFLPHEPCTLFSYFKTLEKLRLDDFGGSIAFHFDASAENDIAENGIITNLNFNEVNI